MKFYVTFLFFIRFFCVCFSFSTLPLFVEEHLLRMRALLGLMIISITQKERERRRGWQKTTPPFLFFFRVGRFPFCFVFFPFCCYLKSSSFLYSTDGHWGSRATVNRERRDRWLPLLLLHLARGASCS